MPLFFTFTETECEKKLQEACKEIDRLHLLRSGELQLRMWCENQKQLIDRLQQQLTRCQQAFQHNQEVILKLRDAIGYYADPHIYTSNPSVVEEGRTIDTDKGARANAVLDNPALMPMPISETPSS